MEKMNNKGFSLVELIIVIAIMAILIGVLAPQYIKYVEKSRVSSDQDCADSLKNALMTATTDDEYIYSLENGYGAYFDSTGIHKGLDTKGGVQAALDEYFKDWGDKKVKSKSYQGHTYKVSIEGTDILKVSADWN